MYARGGWQPLPLCAQKSQAFHEDSLQNRGGGQLQSGLDKDALSAGLAAEAGAESALDLAPSVMECILGLSVEVTSRRCVSSHQEGSSSVSPSTPCSSSVKQKEMDEGL